MGSRACVSIHTDLCGVGRVMFSRYRRRTIAELRPYLPGEDLSRVSVGDNCTAAGGPVNGDMIARDPFNHDDQWIVLASYFAEHFVPVVPA